MNKHWKPSVFLAAAAATGLVLAGCTPSSGDSSADASASVPAPTTQASQGVISPVLPPVPELQDAQGIRSSVTLEQCALAAGPVTANGQASNTTGSAADLVIVIDWTTASSDVVARGVAELKEVAPGATVPWSTTAQLDYQGAVNCIPSAQAGKLK